VECQWEISVLASVVFIKYWNLSASKNFM